MNTMQVPQDNSDRNKKILAAVAAFALIGGYMGYSHYQKAQIAKKRAAAAAKKAEEKKAKADAQAAQAAEASKPPPPKPEIAFVNPTADQQATLIKLAVESNLTELKKMMENGNLSPDFTINASDVPDFVLLQTEAKGGLERYMKPGTQNWNLIFIAAASRNKQMAQYLMGSRRASVNPPSPDSMSPLGAAIENDDADMAKLLIAGGAQIDPKAIYVAEVFDRGKNATMMAALMAGAHNQGVDLTPAMPDLAELIKSGNKDLIKTLAVQNMLKVNAPMSNGILPLSFAAAQNQTDILKTLIIAGATIDARDNHGRTALFYSAGVKDSANIAGYLLDSGADADALSVQKVTPLIMAIARKDAKLTEVLIDAGADVDAQADGGIRPLFLASQNGDSALVRELIGEGAEVNFQGANGWTPLMFAAARGNYTLVRALMRAGASDRFKNKQGHKASEIAAQKGFIKISDFIENPRQISIEYGMEAGAKKK